MPRIVNGVLVKQGQVLLALRSADRRTYPDTWSFPGGHVEAGESLEEALLRELREEIGVTATLWLPMDGLAYRDEDALFHFFCVEEWQGDVSNLGEEHSALRWVDLDQASGMLQLTFPVYLDVFAALIRRFSSEPGATD